MKKLDKNKTKIEFSFLEKNIKIDYQRIKSYERS